MNKLGIFMNFWEKNWDADHKKYIKKAAEIGFDVLEFFIPFFCFKYELIKQIIAPTKKTKIKVSTKKTGVKIFACGTFAKINAVINPPR